MLNLQFNPFPEMHTARLHLRRITLNDANEMFFLRSDQEVQRYVDRPRATSVDDAVNYINEMNVLIDENEVILWGISLNSDPKLIGYVCFFKIDSENYRCETGYLLHPAYHKKGIMKEALTVALDYAFSAMRLHTITADVNPENIASIALLRSLGFLQEAFFKENFYFNGKFLDTAIFTMINPAQTSNIR